MRREDAAVLLLRFPKAAGVQQDVRVPDGNIGGKAVQFTRMAILGQRCIKTAEWGQTFGSVSIMDLSRIWRELEGATMMLLCLGPSPFMP